MASPEQLDDPTIALINLPPTPQQKKSALAVAAVLIVALAIMTPFAATELPRAPAFIPNLNATISVTDLITALLLFAQYSVYRSRALLVLASGYLFTALIVIPHALTFPGAFTPTGLLGAGLQTTAWLYIFWHLGFPLALVAYAWLKDEPPETHRARGSIAWPIVGCVAITVGLVLALVWLATAGERFLPRLFMDPMYLSSLGAHAPAAVLVVSAFALGFLWLRRRSVLDLWLMVVACSLIGEMALTVVRFSLGFYASRIFSLVTSTVVLFILLGEITRLYTRLANSNMALRREQTSKLMNLEAVVASIAHETRQPLAAIVMRGDSALRGLGRASPDLDKVRSAVTEIINDGHRISQVFDNIRDLFRTTGQRREPIDVNEMVTDALNVLRAEFREHRVNTRSELMPDPPHVMGHRGQLQEVLLNLIHNAVEAMATVNDRRRVLQLTTTAHGGNAVAITVADSGPGIAPEKLDTIFEAYFTTKPQGMGLGLAICRMIVERHGGQLLASSDGKSGASFQIVLPVALEAGPAAT